MPRIKKEPEELKKPGDYPSYSFRTTKETKHVLMDIAKDFKTRNEMINHFLTVYVTSNESYERSKERAKQ